MVGRIFCNKKTVREGTIYGECLHGIVRAGVQIATGYDLDHPG